VTGFTVNRDRHRFAVFHDADTLVLERKQHEMVDLITEPLHDPFELDEIEDEPALLVERPFNRNPRAVIVAVQSFATMTREGDEVRRREDQIILGHRNAEVTASLHEALSLHFSPLT